MIPALVALACLGSLASPAAAPDAAVYTAPTLADKQQEEAKQLVHAASEAFGRGDFSQAIALYEEAMRRRPSPRLHFNLGVCHERMIAGALTPEEGTRHADAAIEAYNRYIQEDSGAADRMTVADRVRALGGTPANEVGLKSVFDGASEDPERDPDPDPDPIAPTTSAPSDPPAHGKLAVNLSAGAIPQLADVPQVEADTLVALSAFGGAFVGKRRRLLLGVGLGLYSGGATEPASYALLGGHLGPTIDMTAVMGDQRRIELSAGMIAAVARQSIHTRGATAPHPICSDQVNTRIGARNGFFGAGRFSFAVLVGHQRAHAISVDLQPGIAAFGKGKTASGCDPDQTPFAARGVSQTPVLMLLGGLGYALRF